MLRCILYRTMYRVNIELYKYIINYNTSTVFLNIEADIL